jgi:hypothetical protein
MPLCLGIVGESGSHRQGIARRLGPRRARRPAEPQRKPAIGKLGSTQGLRLEEPRRGRSRIGATLSSLGQPTDSPRPATIPYHAEGAQFCAMIPAAWNCPPNEPLALALRCRTWPGDSARRCHPPRRPRARPPLAV